MKILEKLIGLSDIEKNIIWIFVIYSIGTAFGNVFINTYIYFHLGGVQNLLLFNLLYYSFIYFGFLFSGYFGYRYHISAKSFFYFGFLAMSFAFFFLLVSDSVLTIPLFALIYGIGFGSYWIAGHSYELNFIEKSRRTLYSSIIVLSKDLISFTIPLGVAMIFFLSEQIIPFPTYAVLFFLFGIINLCCIFFVGKLPDYYFHLFTPAKVFSIFKKKDFFQTAYILNQTQVIQITRLVIVILMIYIYHSEVKIGLYQAFSFLFALIVGSFIGKKFASNSMPKYFLIFSCIISCNFLGLLFGLTEFSFFIFLLIMSAMFPLYGICDKIILMEYMGNMQSVGKNFLNQIAQRETLFFIARGISFLFLYIISLIYNLEDIIFFLILYCAGVFLLSPFFVFLDKKYS